MSAMSAADVVREVVRRGHTVRLDGETLVVRPPMKAELRERVLARKGDIVAYLREGAPPASLHRYVLWSGVVDQDRSVCIACGKPPTLHGDGALDNALVVDDPNSVALIEASAIIASASAGALFG